MNVPVGVGFDDAEGLERLAVLLTYPEGTKTGRAETFNLSELAGLEAPLEKIKISLELNPVPVNDWHYSLLKAEFFPRAGHKLEVNSTIYNLLHNGSSRFISREKPTGRTLADRCGALPKRGEKEFVIAEISYSCLSGSTFVDNHHGTHVLYSLALNENWPGNTNGLVLYSYLGFDMDTFGYPWCRESLERFISAPEKPANDGSLFGPYFSWSCFSTLKDTAEAFGKATRLTAESVYEFSKKVPEQQMLILSVPK